MTKKLGVGVACVCAGMWVAASLAGAGQGVATALFMCFFAGCVGGVGCAAYFLGLDGLVAVLTTKEGYAMTAFDRFVAPYLDVWRGCIVLALWPAFVGYLAFSAVKRGVHRCRGVATRRARATPAQGHRPVARQPSARYTERSSVCLAPSRLRARAAQIVRICTRAQGITSRATHRPQLCALPAPST